MKKIFSIAIFLFMGIIVSAQTTDPDAPPPPIPTAQLDSAAKNTDPVYSYAEVMPMFPGSDGAFIEYLQKNIQYPEPERKARKQGTVYVSFIVEKDGSITNVEIVKAVADAPEFSTEAIRVFSSMPKWSPGQMNGHPVRVKMVQPVAFRL